MAPWKENLLHITTYSRYFRYLLVCKRKGCSVGIVSLGEFLSVLTGDAPSGDYETLLRFLYTGDEIHLLKSATEKLVFHNYSHTANARFVPNETREN